MITLAYDIILCNLVKIIVESNEYGEVWAVVVYRHK